MVTIPTPQQQGQPVGSVQTEAARTPSIQVRAADLTQPGREMEALGGALQGIGEELEMNRQRVRMREGEYAMQQWQRDNIYNPQTGLYTRRGGQAYGSADSYYAAAEAERQRIMTEYGSDLIGSNREALDYRLRGATNGVYTAAATYELRENESYEAGLHAATVETNTDRAATYWNNDEEYESAITSTVNVATDEAEGQSSEAVAAHVQERTTAVALSRAGRMLTEAPDTVEDFVQREMEAGRIDRTEGEAWLAQNESVIVENQAKMVVYAAQQTQPTATVIDPVAGSPLSTFMQRMIMRESSNRADLVDGYSGEHFGLFQFGAARFQEVKDAGVVPADMTLREFATEENRHWQMAAGTWHFQDIDRAIDAGGYLDKGWSRDGLRAAAHIGGKGGMHAFVMGGGVGGSGEARYGLGTSRGDYYTLFSGHPRSTAPSPDRQIADLANSGSMRDRMVADRAGQLLEAQRARQHRADQRLQSQTFSGIIADFERSRQEGYDFDLNNYLSTPGVIETLGEKVETLQDYITRQETGADVATSPQTIRDIEAIIRTDPQRFVDTDLIADYSDGLSNADLEEYLREQTDVAANLAKVAAGGEGDRWTRALTTSMVSDVVAANPVLAENARSAGRNIDESVLQNQLIQQAMGLARTFKATNGREASDMELNGIVRNLLSSEVANYDPAGAGPGINAQRTEEELQHILRQADQQPIARFMTEGEVDLTLSYNLADGSVLQHDVTPDEFRSVFNALRSVYKRAPLASEVIAAMQTFPPDDIEERMNDF